MGASVELEGDAGEDTVAGLGDALAGLGGAVDILGVYGNVRADWNPAYGMAVIPAVFLARMNGFAAIGFVFMRALGEWRRNGGRIPHEEDSAEVRERFLEFSTVLLAGLSFIAVIYTALPAAMMVDCR